MNGMIIYLVLFIVLFVFLNYNYYKQKRRTQLEEKRKEELPLESFFYHPDLLSKSKRRKIWIYLPLEQNARVWENFGSRTSNRLHLSIINLCVKSIIDWCSQSYDIVLFTDQDINEILKSKVDLSTLSGDVLDKHRKLYILEILHEYGGILVPHTLYLRNSLKTQDLGDRWYVCDGVNTQSASCSKRLPSTFLMGAPAKDCQLREYIDSLYKDEKEEYEENYFIQNRVFIMDGTVFGTKDKRGQDVTLDDLMSNQKISLPEYNVGLYMPYQELMTRNYYKWYCKMSERQVLKTDCAFSYYMIENS
jgi:hypothetical protein